jgi:hypothetical protein
MSNCYQIILEEDPETGDLIMPFPRGLLDSLGWKANDVLVWTVHENGEVWLSRK